ncbi:MAG: MFS transporter [Canibacter sp.]
MTSAPGFSETGTTWLGYRRATGQYRKVLIVMFLAGVATFAQLYAPQAVLPELSEYFEVPISSAALVVSAGTIGLAVTVLPWSIVADRIGRRKSIAIAVFVATVCALAISVAPSFELVLALRVLEGAALGGVPAAAIAYVNEEIHPIDAAVASGIFIAGNTIGGIAGRIITGPITEVTGSWRLGVFVVAAVSVVCAVLFIWLAPRAKGYIPAKGADVRPLLQDFRSAFSVSLRHLKQPKLLSLYALAFLLMGGFVAIYNYLGAHLNAPPYLLPVWVTSLAFLAYLAGTVSSPIAGRYTTVYGRKRVMLTSTGIAILALGVMMIPSLWAVIAGLVLFTAAFFGVHAVAVGWAGSAATVGRAQSTALYNFAYYFGSSLIGYAAGLFFDAQGWIVMVIAIMVLYAVSFVIAYVLLPHKPPGPATVNIRSVSD